MLSMIYLDMGTCFYMFEQKKEENFQNFTYKIHGKM